MAWLKRDLVSSTRNSTRPITKPNLGMHPEVVDQQTVFCQCYLHSIAARQMTWNLSWNRSPQQQPQLLSLFLSMVASRFQQYKVFHPDSQTPSPMPKLVQSLPRLRLYSLYLDYRKSKKQMFKLT